MIPYDPTGANFAARLTIDLGNDDLYLTTLAAYATTNWLKTSGPVLDYGNAMVASQNTTVGSLETGWQQHVQGTSSVPPLAPAKLTGSLWVVANSPSVNCVGPFSSSDQETAFNFVSTIPPSGAGTTAGMLGYMFWATGQTDKAEPELVRARDLSPASPDVWTTLVQFLITTGRRSFFSNS